MHFFGEATMETRQSTTRKGWLDALIIENSRPLVAGLLGVAILNGWNMHLRGALLLMFLVTASAH